MQTIYIINFILPFIYYVILKVINIKYKVSQNIILIMYSVQVILLVGTRTLSTGTDTITYYQFFSSLNNANISDVFYSRFEPLFWLIYFAANKFGLGFIGANIIIAGLTMFFFSKAVIKMRVDCFLSCFFYTSFFFVNNMMNQIRQALAMAIILYAVSLLQLKEGKVNFLIFILAATGVHKSALVALVILVIYKYSISRKIIILYFIVSIVIAFFPEIFLGIARQTVYGEYLTYYGVFTLTSILNLVLRVCMLAFSIIFIPENKTEKYNIFYHMAFICTVVQILTVINSAIARITTIFYYSYLILMPASMEKSERFKRYRTLLYPIVIVFFSIYYYVYLTRSGETEVYQSYLFNNY